MRNLIKIVRGVLLYLLLFLWTFCGSVFAGEISEIELTDGSVLYGEIISFMNGTYTVKSGSMGTVKIDESKVRLIRLNSHGSVKGKSSGSSNTSLSKEAQDLQHVMLSDEHLLNAVLSLQNDPEIQEILNDPAIVNAVNSGNIDALLSNPKFMQLLGNPKIQAITKEVVEQIPGAVE